MIRRRHGDHWLLISQNDHAALSGELACHVGGIAFAKMDQRAILGCRLHDVGWPDHDDAPTLNAEGLPLDVFETPRELGLPIWTASAERAAAVDSYAGLMVSLHSLALSAMPVPAPARFDNSQMRERFENNKFQHKQIELQENLRRRLEMRTDMPLTLGLSDPGVDSREDQLLFDFRWLAALDQISLAVCCTQNPFFHVAVYARPGRRLTELRFWRAGNDLIIDPWPLEVREFSCHIVGRLVAGERWASQQAFQEAYRVAPIERIEVRIKQRMKAEG